MKIKCAVCGKVDSLSEDEKSEIGAIFDKKDLNVEEYLSLVQIFRSKEICELMEGEGNKKHIWIYDAESDDKIAKMIDEHLMIIDAENILTDRNNELRKKVDKLREEIELSNKELGEIVDKLTINDKDRTKNRLDFKELTGSYKIEKWA